MAEKSSDCSHTPIRRTFQRLQVNVETNVTSERLSARLNKVTLNSELLHTRRLCGVKVRVPVIAS
jgi:hypothetical protein